MLNFNDHGEIQTAIFQNDSLKYTPNAYMYLWSSTHQGIIRRIGIGKTLLKVNVKPVSAIKLLIGLVICLIHTHMEALMVLAETKTVKQSS